MATRLGVADDKTIRFLGGGVEPIASMFDQRSPRLQKQEGESKGWKKGATADSSSVDKGRAGVFDCRPLPRQSVVVQSRQGFSGGCLLSGVGHDKGAIRWKPRTGLSPTPASTSSSRPKVLSPVFRPRSIVPEHPSTRSREPTKFSRQPLLSSPQRHYHHHAQNRATHQTSRRLPTFPSK